jgi:Yersinia/Haemophilus virulence surface antigen
MPDKERLNAAIRKHQESLISFWNQGGRDLAGDGVCMGMCLDWIRRILNGRGSFGTAEAPRSHVYNPDEESALPWKESKEKKRFDLQASTHTAMRQAQGNVLETELDQELNALVAQFKKLYGHEPSKAQVADMSLRFYRTNMAKIQKLAYENFQTQWLLSTAKAPGWFGSEPRLKKANYDRIKIDTESLPRFVAGEALAGAPLSQYVKGAILRLGEQGSCGVLTVSKESTSGHDMGFHVPAAGASFYFFDPNIGEFRFGKDRADFGDFWIELWESVYRERGYVAAMMSRFYWQ